MLLKLSSLQQNILMVFGVVASIGVVSYFVLLPTIRHINATSTQIEAQKEYLDRQLQKGITLKEVQSSYDAIQPLYEQLRTISLHEGEELDFITELEQLADTHHIDLTLNLTIPNDTAPTSDKIHKVLITAQVEGDYENILTYLQEMERLNYYLVTERLSFALLQGSENISTQFHAYAHWQKK